MMISVLIPCYNEEGIIFHSYKKLKEELGYQDNHYEIIFCNDGSIDNTLKLLTDIKKQDEKVIVISYNRNKGAGYAFRQMCSKAKGEILIHMDADLAMEPSETIPLFLKEIKCADVIIASRYAGVKPYFPFRRRIPSKIFLLLNNIIFRCRFKDTNSGFFVIKRDILDRIRISSNDFEFQAELFIKAKKRGFNVKEIPVRFIHKTESGEASMIKHAPRMLKDIFNLLLE